MAAESLGDEKLESPAVETRVVLFAGLGALLLVAFAIGVLEVVYYWQVPVQTLPAPEIFPKPRVVAGQEEQLRRLTAKQNSRLDGYRWVDRKQGLVQIPIKRAMQLLAAKGQQAYEPLAPAQALSVPGAGAERLLTPIPGAASDAGRGGVPAPQPSTKAAVPAPAKLGEGAAPGAPQDTAAAPAPPQPGPKP